MRLWFCKHKWRLLSEKINISQFELAMEQIKTSFEGEIKIPPQMCNADRKHIQVFTCEKCGKLKRFVTKI